MVNSGIDKCHARFREMCRAKKMVPLEAASDADYYQLNQADRHGSRSDGQFDKFLQDYKLCCTESAGFLALTLSVDKDWVPLLKVEAQVLLKWLYIEYAI